MAYNPSVSYGGGAYGSNVAPIPMPTPAADLAAQIPGVSGLNQQLSGLIGSELSGNISPSTLQLLKNISATSGVTTGMPGSGLNLEGLLTNAGLTSEAQQQKGVQNYQSIIPTVSGTQTVAPALQAEVNLQNAVSAAAPNPMAAAEQEQSLLQQYMDELNAPAGPTGGFQTGPQGQFVSGDKDVYDWWEKQKQSFL